MPCDYSKYPPNWKEIRARILARANNCCEECAAPNGELIYRFKANPLKWRTPNGCDLGESDPETSPVKIVLTIAHLDHDEANWEVTDERLKALCQRCHLRYDAPEKLRRRRAKASQTAGHLFEKEPWLD